MEKKESGALKTVAVAHRGGGVVLRAMPELPGPRVQVRSGWAQGLYGHGFSEQVTVLTRLSCLGFSCGEGLSARSDSERSRGAGRLQVCSGQYFTAMLVDN